MEHSEYRWYLSAKAVRQYLRIAGLPDDDGGPQWMRGERELGEHCAAARLYAESDEHQIQTWRTGRRRLGDRPKSARLDLRVSTAPRSEGPLDQLVFVQTR